MTKRTAKCPYCGAGWSNAQISPGHMARCKKKLDASVVPSGPVTNSQHDMGEESNPAYRHRYEELHSLAISSRKSKVVSHTTTENGKHIAPQQRCVACGQFVASNSRHSCAMKKVATLSPAISLAGTAGLAAAAFALGPVAVAAVGVLAVGFFAAKHSFLRKKIDAMAHKTHTLRTPTQLEELETDTQELAMEMNVEGSVRVTYREGKDSKTMPNASAFAGKDGRHVIFVNEALLDLPPEQVRAIMAHEVAHLQQKGRLISLRNFVRGTAMPVGMATGAAVGTAAGLGAASGGVAAVAWIAVLAAAAAITRVEERRADKEAYRVAGENFPKSLENVHSRIHGSVRPDLPWRVEDLLSTHGNLPNRLIDMRS